DEHVLLDMTHLGKAFLVERFPTIYATCKQFGVDMAVQPIPVVPAAHYLCGGVVSDLHGRTDVDGLFAIGEVACTGLHGANRLASNSLLEALVAAHRAADEVRARLATTAAAPRAQAWHAVGTRPPREAGVSDHNWDPVRRAM